MMVRYRSTACLSVGAVQLITFIYLTMQRTEHNTTSVFCTVFSFISSGSAVFSFKWLWTALDWG